VSAVFKVVPLPIEDWELMAAAGVLPFIVMELMKMFRRR
jgi:hypothetical protein